MSLLIAAVALYLGSNQLGQKKCQLIFVGQHLIIIKKLYNSFNDFFPPPSAVQLRKKCLKKKSGKGNFQPVPPFACILHEPERDVVAVAVAVTRPQSMSAMAAAASVLVLLLCPYAAGSDLKDLLANLCSNRDANGSLCRLILSDLSFDHREEGVKRYLPLILGEKRPKRDVEGRDLRLDFVLEAAKQLDAAEIVLIPRNVTSDD